MIWDQETHRAITLARLKVAMPETVYAELRAYGEHVAKRILGSPDEELEAALLARDDPMINLGLAQFGANEITVSFLYRRSFSSQVDDPKYGKGLRLACLANRTISRTLFGAFFGRDSAIDAAELRRLAEEGDEDEISVIFANPSAGGVIQTLYNCKAPFDDITDERRCSLVYASIKNPRINIDEGNEHGPDMLSWDIQKGILSMLQSAPVESRWLQALHSLLSALDPHIARTLDSDLQEILKRWSTLSLKKTFGDQTEDAEGWTTSLSLVDEFRCLIAALYGKRFAKNKFEVLGGPDDPEIVQRCAFYGNGTMTVVQMRAGYQLDGDIFVFAALLNENLYFKIECRAELEDQISGDLRHAYARRCEQIQKRRPAFDKRPVSESGATVLEDVIEQAVSAEATALSRIEAQLEALKSRISDASRASTWGFLIVLGLLIYVRR